MINSRAITDLHPTVAKMAAAFIHECSKQGIDVIITSTYRDFESQNELYAQGRTKPGKKVTNAKPGASFHNYRLAFDFCPIVRGKAAWNDTETFVKCGKIGKEVGLEWAGDWVKFKELAHLQYTGGLTLLELQQGAKLEVKDV